jgi:hypothetical protein
MTIRQLVKHSRELWNTGNQRLDRYNRKAWVRSVIRLGDRWLLAKNVHRIQHL